MRRGHAHPGSRLLSSSAALLMAFITSITPSLAQQPTAEADPLAAAFLEMVFQPNDPAAVIRYARLAAGRGDARAAIVALERVLRLDPSLDNIRLELASLHLVSGSPDLAAAYARQALESPSIPPEAATRARGLLRQAERGAARSTLDATLFLGGRYDSNAQQTSQLGNIPVFFPGLIGPIDFPNPGRSQSDWSAVLGARVTHRYDLGLQRPGAWETNAAGFEQRFARIPRYWDLSLLSADTGPRLSVAQFGDGRGELLLRPFGSVSWIGYGGETYAWLYGGGIGAELRLPPHWTLDLTWLGRFGNYENSNARPSARDYTGFEWGLASTLIYALRPATFVGTTLLYYAGDARQDFFGRSSWGGWLFGTATTRITPAYEIGASARVGLRRAVYDAPDPILNPTESRRDTRWEAGASLIFPVTSALALTLDYDWFDQSSNTRIYRYGDHAVTFGLRLRI